MDASLAGMLDGLTSGVLEGLTAFPVIRGTLFPISEGSGPKGSEPALKQIGWLRPKIENKRVRGGGRLERL